MRERILASIERIVAGECAAAGSPRPPDFEPYDQFPLTSNDTEVTARVTAAFIDHFGADVVGRAAPQTASEDFSRIPDAFGVPYSFWFLGGVDADSYRLAAEKGTIAQDISANHSPRFAPVIDPSLSMGVQAQVIAALSYLAKEQ